MKSTKRVGLILSAFMLLAFTAAQADVMVLVTSPTGSDTVNWASIGLPLGGDGNVGILRSPLRAIVLPDDSSGQ